MDEVRALCNLSDEDYAARRKELRETLLPQIRRRVALENGVVLEFYAEEAIRLQLDEFVAFERDCCPSLEYSIRNKGEVLELEILGVNPNADFFLQAPNSCSKSRQYRMHSRVDLLRLPTGVESAAH